MPVAGTQPLKYGPWMVFCGRSPARFEPLENRDNGN